ncbi:MAG: fasciclin domain-containing protein [Bacteroides sp.]|nr:fasciclin domain-containing protein [Bacteroides sp.]
MTINNLNKFLGTSMLAMLSLMGGCASDWNDHYSPQDSEKSDQTVLQLIKSNPDLSVFAGMIEAAGMADMLNTTQTYTIWVPSNEALSEVDLNDEEEVKRIVANHIARYNISSSTNPEKYVRMYNGKMNRFNGNTFAGVELIQSDIIASNGVLHLLKEAIPYRYNLREYINTHPEYSLLADFLSRYDEQKFDEESSAPLDVDENGNTVYDTVTVAYNRLFEHPVYGLGSIEAEDSVFTMLIPDNRAWQEAYDKISPYFIVYNADVVKADSIRDVQTSLAIVSDLIFRSEITEPQTAGPQTTTSGSLITDMAAMFTGSIPEKASNGMIYLTSSLYLDPTATFNKPINVEAEETTGRETTSRTAVYTRVIGTDNPFYNDLSGHSYLEVQSTTVSASPGVTFRVPGVLSGKYDIYATFVPAIVEDASQSNDSTRLMFTFHYPDPATGKNIQTVFEDETFLTSGTQMTTIKVADGFKFPVSDFTDRLWIMDPLNDYSNKLSTITVDVEPNVGRDEFNNGILTRRFRIDRIYLIPVTD